MLDKPKQRESQPVGRDDTLVIYLQDNDVDAVKWRSPDGTEMSALCAVEVVKDGMLRCGACGEFDNTVGPPERPTCTYCLAEAPDALAVRREGTGWGRTGAPREKEK